jgi:hypothetical protein
MPINDAPDYDSPRWQVAEALTDAQQQAALDAVRAMSFPFPQASIDAVPVALALASAMMDMAQAARVASDAFRGLATAFSKLTPHRGPR